MNGLRRYCSYLTRITTRNPVCNSNFSSDKCRASIFLLLLVAYYVDFGCAQLIQSQQTYAITGTDFYDMTTSDVAFVDKTMMIEEYLRNPARVILITRPRRWGKTTNALMLKRFLEIEINQSGHRLPADQSVNRQLFIGGSGEQSKLIIGKSGGEVSTKPLKISSSGYSLEHQGRYPVLFTSFSTVGAANYDGMKCFLKWKIDKMFADHYYLKLNAIVNNNNNCSTAAASTTNTGGNDRLPLNSAEMEMLNIYLNQTYNDEQLTESVAFLSRLLYRYYGEKVHLIIDEFDTPIISLFANLVGQYRRRYKKNNNGSNSRTSSTGSSSSSSKCIISDEQIFAEAFASDDMQRTIKLLKSLLTKCLQSHNNPALEKALITGIARMKSADLFDEMTDEFREYTILDEGFSDHYGFGQQEVDQLLTEFGDKRDRYRSEIASKYGWYNTMGRKRLYNPWSIRNYLEYGGKLRYYWTNSAYTRLTEDFLVYPNVQQQLQRMTEGKSLKIAVVYPIILENCTGNDFYNVLLFIGHLTQKNDSASIVSTHSSAAGFNRTYELVIPNKEVNNVCMENILEYWY